MICCILRKNVKIQIGIIHITITIIIVIVTIHIITSSASASRGSLLLSVLTWGGGKWYRVANIPWLTFIIIHFPNKEFKIVISGQFRTLAGGRWCLGWLVRFPNPLSSGRHSWQLGNLTKVYLQWQRKSWNLKKMQHLLTTFEKLWCLGSYWVPSDHSKVERIVAKKMKCFTAKKQDHI